MPAPVAIGRLRLHGQCGDALALRLGVDRQLGAADLRPSRLPPAATLVVRSLHDPLPGRLDTRATIPAPEWQQAVSAALDQIAARAARPAHEAVAADADAVVFADRAELLACAARDWCDGSLATRWWWRALDLDAPASLLRAYAETPDAVPAALAAMAARGLLVPFAARIPPPTAAALARAVGTAFGARPAAEAALVGGSGSSAVVTRGVAAHAAQTPDTRVPPPWRDVRSSPPALASLAPEQEALAGIALVLRERPAAAQVAAFAQAAAAWHAGRVARPLVAAPAAPSAPGAPATPGRPRPRSTARSRGNAAAPRKPRRGVAPERYPTSRAEVGPGGARAPTPPAQTDGGTAEPLALVVHTRLGGLFHLVLAGQLIGLYGDFTTPGRAGIALDMWDFVELLGRRLLGRPPADPAWRLLAQLAGRVPGDAPGAGYRPPRTWRVPRAWLAPFHDGGTWRHGERDGRVVLVHPAGFAVVDSARADIARELRRHGIAHARTGARVREPASALDRWVAHLADYVRARLALALGVPARAAPRLALLRPARVLVTDTRVDVISALADLPIEVRLAGLDRDPGHVPAAGRALYFHFE